MGTTEVARPFSDWLKERLDERGWSQAELSRRMEVFSSLVSKWTRGEQRPRPAQCHRLAEALGLDPDEVLAAAGHRAPPRMTAGALHHEAHVLVDRIPAERLPLAIPLLEALADPIIGARAIGRLQGLDIPDGWGGGH